MWKHQFVSKSDVADVHHHCGLTWFALLTINDEKIASADIYIYIYIYIYIPLGPNVFFTSPGTKHIECHHLLGGIDGNSRYFNFGSISVIN